MELIEASNLITVRPYKLENGKMPSTTAIKNLLEEHYYPKKKSGWKYGFISSSGSGRNRVILNFLAEVAFNVSSIKIVDDEISKSTTPMKKLEMIGVQFSRKNIEIIGTKPQTTALLFSLLKEKFDITVTPFKNEDFILDRIFEASFLIRNVRAQTKIGKQDVVVGLRSGEQLEESTITPIFKKSRNLLTVGGKIRLPNKSILSFQSNASGANLLYSSKKYPVKWRDISIFLDNYIYPEP
ncbi:MAG: hypothetical protein ACTSUV_06900 [Candidatus Ranarchaeia archaeon]